MTERIPTVMLLIETSREHGRQLLRGVAEYARFHGPWTLHHEPGGRRVTWTPEGKRSRLDGIIVHGTKCVDLGDVPLPIVCTSDHVHAPGVVGLSTDNEAVGRLAADHLLERGFHHFGFCGLQDSTWSDQREGAFSRRVAEAGHAVHAYRRSQAAVRRSWERVLRRLTAWLEALPKPVGVLACNDERGKHVIEACKVAGLAVPAQVSVVGVDNDEVVCGLCNPPLTSIALSYKQAGYEAAEALDGLMRGRRRAGPPIVNRVQYLVPRPSTDILAIDDPVVVRAIEYIHRRARQPLQVVEVAEAVGVSTRWLYNRFHALLGHSVYDEIARVRAEQIARMLVDTDLPISRIAASLGFRGMDHVARYFKRRRGMTPMAFRKLYGRR